MPFKRMIITVYRDYEFKIVVYGNETSLYGMLKDLFHSNYIGYMPSSGRCYRYVYHYWSDLKEKYGWDDTVRAILIRRNRINKFWISCRDYDVRDTSLNFVHSDKDTVCITLDIGDVYYYTRGKPRKVTVTVCLAKELGKIVLRIDCNVWKHDYIETLYIHGDDCWFMLDDKYFDNEFKPIIPVESFKNMMNLGLYYNNKPVDEYIIAILSRELYTMIEKVTGNTELWNKYLDTLKDKLGIEIDFNQGKVVING